MSALIAIVGNAGVGKTTLTRKLCAATGYHSALEQHAERPYQRRFAADLTRYALANQLDYLLFRAEQEVALCRQGGSAVVDGGLDLDYHGFTHLFHRRGYLDDDAFALCGRQHALLRSLLPPPALYIYLMAPLEVVLDRHRQRNRMLEITAQRDLADLDVLIAAWMAGVDPADKLVIDAGAADFATPAALIQLVKEVQARLDLSSSASRTASRVGAITRTPPVT